MTKREEAAQALLDWFSAQDYVGSVTENTLLSYIDMGPVDMLDLVDVVMSSLASSKVT